MKINKYQQGSGIIPITYNVLQRSVPSIGGTAVSGSQELTEDPFLDKDIVKSLYEKGLPSDVRYFLDKSSIFSSSLSLQNPFSNTNNTLAKYKELLMYMNNIAWEKEQFDDAMTHIRSIDGMSEIAVSAEGGVYTMRDGSLKLIGVGDIKEGDRLLTNVELANLRANSLVAAFNSSITAALTNATSMKLVRLVMEEAFKGLNSTDNTSPIYFHRNESSAEALLFLADMNLSLADLLKMDFNSLLEVKIQNKDNTLLVIHAVDTIYSLLTPNMRALLAVRGKELGIDDTRNLIFEWAKSRVGGTRSITTDIMNTKTGGRGSTGNASGDDIKMTPAMLLLSGYGQNDWVTINTGTKAQMSAYGTLGVMTDSSDKPIGQTAAVNILNSNYAGIMDVSNMSIGGQKIDLTALNSIMLKDSRVVAFDLPIDLQKYAQTGIKVPDLEMARKVQNIEEQIKTLGITDPATINKLYADAGLPAKYNGVDELGRPKMDITHYARFMAMNVIANGEAVPGGLSDNGLVLEVTEESILNNFQTIMLKHNEDFEYETGSFDWMPFYDNPEVYQGVLYIPMIENMVNAAFGLTMDQTAMHRLDAFEQATDRVNTAADRYNPSKRTDYNM